MSKKEINTVDLSKYEDVELLEYKGSKVYLAKPHIDKNGWIEWGDFFKYKKEVSTEKLVVYPDLLKSNKIIEDSLYYVNMCLSYKNSYLQDALSTINVEKRTTALRDAYNQIALRVIDNFYYKMTGK